MSRAAAMLLALAFLVLVAAPPSSAGNGSPACLWHQHTKRTAKKVKHHGKVRRVKRTKRWWTCQAQPAPAPAPTPQPTPTPTPPPPEAEPQPELARLGVKAKEWSYTL